MLGKKSDRQCSGNALQQQLLQNPGEGKTMRMILGNGAAVLLSAAFVGCATIIGNPTQLLPISSTPSDATVLIVDEKGTAVFKGATPTTVTLAKSSGGYWSGKSYTITISKDGYDPQTIPVTSSPNGWYIAGNFVFGGLIGWFIVDPFNGHMYTLSPDVLSPTLGTKKAHNNTAVDGSVAIMLIQDVPMDFRGKMTRVH
jgi:hypothetical protein